MAETTTNRPTAKTVKATAKSKTAPAKPATRKAIETKAVAAKAPAAKAKTAAANKPAVRKATPSKPAKTSSRPAAKTNQTVKEPILMTKTIEAPEFVRAFTEKSVEQAREAYARVKGTAEEATDAIEETFETARDNLLDVQHKSLDIAKANVDATFDLARNLLGVTSVGDAIQLQTSFARDRIESLMDYSKVLQSSATKMAEETSKPAKAAFSKAFDGVKVS